MRWLAIPLLLGLHIACADDQSEPGAGTDSDSAGSSEGPTGEVDTETDASDTDDPPPMPGAECGDSPGRVGLQRLTRREYNRTVQDLFGVQSNPADAFPPDPTTDGFDNHAPSLGIDSQLATLLLGAAEEVASEALGDPAAVVTCDPDSDPDCAQATLHALGLRVYRRPLSDDEVGGLLEFVARASADGETFERGIEHALTAMLMSPQFLYRSVPVADQTPAQGDVIRLDDYAIASRLSYFLWGSTPDDRLLAHAGEGRLGGEAGLREEFDRMLADPKSDALFDGFVRQWLALGKLESALPDPVAFPMWSDEVRDAVSAEPRHFFDGLRARDASPLEFVTGTQTYANAALAELYGVEGVTGSAFEAVQTDAEQRAGLLTMPAVLTMTSDPSRTNVVKRGVWLAENILCAAPPPPPAGIGPLPDPQPGETERERLARHRTDPACASCHTLIDPLGFALEGYDPVGRWRTTTDGTPVDNAGELPGGGEFVGAVELGRLLAEDGTFSECVSEKLMTYALGRSMTNEDECRIEQVAALSVSADSTFSDLLWTIVTSDAFQTQASAEEN